MTDNHSNDLVEVVNPAAQGNFVLVCEHASNRIPGHLQNLGLDAEARQSHVAWDPGAYAVARKMSDLLDSPLVASRVSRLVYDCNRSLDAKDAIPAKSEIYQIPGNADLSESQRRQRYRDYYLPFEKALNQCIERANGDKALVTIHSFTPVYFGKPRTLEIGLIHDEDARLAEQMFEITSEFTDLSVALNQPYSMEDGTTHTINTHGTRKQLANMMIEVRNDLIATASDQTSIAILLGDWLRATFAKLE